MVREAKVFSALRPPNSEQIRRRSACYVSVSAWSNVHFHLEATPEHLQLIDLLEAEFGIDLSTLRSCLQVRWNATHIGPFKSRLEQHSRNPLSLILRIHTKCAKICWASLVVAQHWLRLVLHTYTRSSHRLPKSVYALRPSSR